MTKSLEDRIQRLEDVRVEISPLGRWDGPEGVYKAMVKFHEFIGVGKPGYLCVHPQTTPVIQVAGNGKTAKGVWMSLTTITLCTPLHRKSSIYRCHRNPMRALTKKQPIRVGPYCCLG